MSPWSQISITSYNISYVNHSSQLSKSARFSTYKVGFSMQVRISRRKGWICILSTTVPRRAGFLHLQRRRRATPRHLHGVPTPLATSTVRCGSTWATSFVRSGSGSLYLTLGTGLSLVLGHPSEPSAKPLLEMA